jgi:mycoredoxin
MPKYELFGTESCPYTRELREWLEWKGYEYLEYDVETNFAARERMIVMAGGQRIVPVLAEDGVATHIGWLGRGCVIAK